GQTHRRVDIDASEHAVAADIGVDNRFDTVVFKLAAKIEHIMLGQFTPPIGRHFAILGIEADNDIAWKSAAGILQKARILHRRRTDNDVLDAEIQVPFNGVQIADAAADLHRDVVSDSPHDGLDHVFIFGLAGDGPVQVDQMQASRALVIPLFRHGNRVFGKNGGVLQVPLTQAYATPVLQINGWYEQHNN